MEEGVSSRLFCQLRHITRVGDFQAFMVNPDIKFNHAIIQANSQPLQL